jgi:Flp pilus assembly protein TadD
MATTEGAAFLRCGAPRATGGVRLCLGSFGKPPRDGLWRTPPVLSLAGFATLIMVGAIGTTAPRELAVAPDRAAIDSQIDDAEAYHNLGVALHAQGKLEEAAAEYRTAIQLKPDFAQTHYNLGLVMQAQGNSAEAVAEFRMAIRLKLDDATAHYNLGIALRRQGKPEEAIAEFRKARDHAPPGSRLAELIERALSSFDFGSSP